MVEHNLAKVGVASSNLVSRSKIFIRGDCFLFAEIVAQSADLSARAEGSLGSLTLFCNRRAWRSELRT